MRDQHDHPDDHGLFSSEEVTLTNTIEERTCEECGRSTMEFDFHYANLAPPGTGYEVIGRVYVCRTCLGEEEWQRLAQVPEMAPGLFIGRSTRIPQHCGDR
jgi:hypothetical protein